MPTSDDDSPVSGATLTFELGEGKLTLAAMSESLSKYTVVADDDEAVSDAGVGIFSGTYGLSTSGGGPRLRRFPNELRWRK